VENNKKVNVEEGNNNDNKRNDNASRSPTWVGVVKHRMKNEKHENQGKKKDDQYQYQYQYDRSGIQIPQQHEQHTSKSSESKMIVTRIPNNNQSLGPALWAGSPPGLSKHNKFVDEVSY
jgi:hypothetical protein